MENWLEKVEKLSENVENPAEFSGKSRKMMPFPRKNVDKRGKRGMIMGQNRIIGVEKDE